LLRWFNYHLKRANHKPIHNFGGDVANSDAYSTLLSQIAPNICSKDWLSSQLRESALDKRAQGVINQAQALNVKTFIQKGDIVSGNPKLNLAFTAAIFNQCPGLDPLTEEEVKKAGLMDDDVGDSREERSFRMWINSLGIDEVYVNSLFDDCKDGLVLLKVIEKVEPKTVDWKGVELKPNNKFKMLTNDNYAVDLGKALKFSLVNISGTDIQTGNKKLLLGFVWQLMRHHSLKFLREQRARLGAGDSKEVKDDDLINWANKRVTDSGKSSRMTSFNDSSLSTGVFLMDLLATVDARVIDWTFVTPGETKENALSNAKYVISVARKLGATIFLLPEDIVEVKPKMILTFIASCMAVAFEKSATPLSPTAASRTT